MLRNISASARQEWVADKRPIAATPFHISVHQRSIRMTLIPYDTIADRGGNPLLNTLTGYLVRYRLPLYLFAGAVAASGVVLNWHWLTIAGLFRIVVFLPCMLMMFNCMKCGTRG